MTYGLAPLALRVALLGRDAERRRIGDLLERAAARGTAIVVRGEAGIGKSALLREARREAAGRGMRVLTTVGAESEAHLPFAGLQRLLGPVLDQVHRLHAPRRRALLAAFGMVEGASPDPFLIALAVFDLVSEAARDVPLLLVVDGAQWMDRPSAEVFVFLARRIESEPVVMVTAMRDGFSSVMDDPDLDVLGLDRLDQAAAGQLVDRATPSPRPAVRGHVLREAAGNPLALVELPFTVDDGVLASAPAWLPLTTRLQQAFAARASALPTATRTLLLVAALDEGAELSSTLAAATRLVGRAVGLEDLVPAMSARLVESDGRTNVLPAPADADRDPSAVQSRSTPGGARCAGGRAGRSPATRCVAPSRGLRGS